MSIEEFSKNFILTDENESLALLYKVYCVSVDFRPTIDVLQQTLLLKKLSLQFLCMVHYLCLNQIYNYTF